MALTLALSVSGALAGAGVAAAVAGSSSPFATPVVIVAVVAAVASMVSAAAVLLGKRKEVSGASDANLRDDQREFIEVLQKENKSWRAETSELRADIKQLNKEIVGLREALADERHTRQEAEVRSTAEDAARDRIQPPMPEAAKRKVERAGDAAVAEHRQNGEESQP